MALFIKALNLIAREIPISFTLVYISNRCLAFRHVLTSPGLMPAKSPSYQLVSSTINCLGRTVS